MQVTWKESEAGVAVSLSPPLLLGDTGRCTAGYRGGSLLPPPRVFATHGGYKTNTQNDSEAMKDSIKLSVELYRADSQGVRRETSSELEESRGVSGRGKFWASQWSLRWVQVGEENHEERAGAF